MLSEFNLYLFHIVNGPAGNPVIDGIVLLLANTDFSRVMFLSGPLVYAWFSARRPAQRASLFTGVVAACLAVLTARVMTHMLPFEARPMFSPSAGYHPLAKAAADRSFEVWSAFPSDTAAFSIAIAISIASVERRLGLVLIPAVAVIFGVFRVYCGFHYPLDVLAGWVLAAACWVALRPLVSPIGLLIDRLQSAPHVQRLTPLFYTLGFVALFEFATMFDFTRIVIHHVSALRAILHS